MPRNSFERLLDETANQYGSPDIYWEFSTAYQFLEAYEQVSGDAYTLRDKVVLDLGCGSLASRDALMEDDRNFEPWLARALTDMGATVIGVDIGELAGERFAYLRHDLRGVSRDKLAVPSGTIDIVHFSKLLDSPTLTNVGQVSRAPAEEVLRLRQLNNSIIDETYRVLKDGGFMYAATAQYQHIGAPALSGREVGSYTVYQKRSGNFQSIN